MLLDITAPQEKGVAESVQSLNLANGIVDRLIADSKQQSELEQARQLEQEPER